jgi:hypothetical protein
LTVNDPLISRIPTPKQPHVAILAWGCRLLHHPLRVMRLALRYGTIEAMVMARFAIRAQGEGPCSLTDLEEEIIS